MSTTTITIGLNSNVTLLPLAPARARSFVAEVRGILAAAGAEVYVDAATSRGSWTDERTGTPISEESRTWVASVADAARVRDLLGEIARRYDQDAIAVTTGETALVG